MAFTSSLFTFVYALFYAVQLYASAELLPNFKSEHEKSLFVLKLQRKLPFSKRNNSQLIEMQAQAVEALKKKFPNYEEMMLKKPGPFSFEIFETEETNEQTFSLEDTLFITTQKRVDEEFARGLRDLPTKGTTADTIIHILRTRAIKDLQTALKNSNESVRGIIVGLSQIISKEDRATLFKLGDPRAQFDFIAKKGITDEQLRKSQFRAETLGLTSQNITVTKVFEIMSQRLTANQNIFVILSYIQSLDKLLHLETKQKAEILSHGIGITALIKSTDFDFVHKSNSPWLAQLAADISAEGKTSEKDVRGKFEVFQADFSRKYFTSAIRTNKTKKTVGKMYEVPPYMGVLRGCLGGDCSTSNSPLFPYSPGEHVFYIQNASGRLVGNMTVTRVLHGKTESLYVKDLTGPNLSPDLAESVLYVLNSSLHLYGAKKLFLAPPQFTNGQNSNIPLRQMLGQYNQQSLYKLNIPDSEIRTFIGTERAVFRSTLSYDSVAIHSNGVLFRPKQNLAERISQNIGNDSIQSADLKDIAADVLRVARETIHMSKEEMHNKLGTLNLGEHRIAIDIFRNASRETLSQYYKNLRAYLETLEIKLTPSFIAQNEDLFYLGHLSAPDAFTNSRRESIETSEKYFSKIIEARKHPLTAFSIYESANRFLENSPSFNETIKSLAQKMRPEDVFYLVGFAGAGSEKAKKILRHPSNQQFVEEAVESLLTRGKEAFGYSLSQNYLLQTRDFTKISSVFRNASSNTFREFSENLDQSFLHFQLDWRKIKSLTLKTKIQAEFLKTRNIFTSEHRKEAIALLKSPAFTQQLSSADFLEIVAQNAKTQDIQLESAIRQRLKYLIAQKTELAMLEIHALHALGYDLATKFLYLPELAEVNLRTIRKSLDLSSFSDPTANAIFEKFEQYEKRPSVSLKNVRQVLAETFNSPEEGISRFREAFAYLGVSLDKLIETGELFNLTSQQWVKTPKLFLSVDPFVLRFTLGCVLKLLQSQNLSFSWDWLMHQIEYLKQQKEFDLFAYSIREIAMTKTCLHCTRALFYMSLYGHLDKSFFSHRDLVRSLLDGQALAVRSFGIKQAIENNFQDLIPENAFQDLFGNFEKIGHELHHSVYSRYKDSLFNSFEKLTNLSRANRELFLNYARSEPIDKIALRAANIYVQNGGDPNTASIALIQLFPRTSLKSEMPQKFLNLSSCKDLFNGR